jgi:hypothetical protein
VHEDSAQEYKWSDVAEILRKLNKMFRAIGYATPGPCSILKGQPGIIRRWQ